jgi:hypothetical protein
MRPASSVTAHGRTLVAPVLVALATAATITARLLATGNPFDRMWAEDGKLLLANADRPAALIESYAGYGHAVLRLLALPSDVLPVRLWSTYAVLASALAVGVLAAFVYVAARTLIGSSLAAAAAAVSLSLTPALAFESLGSLANLQWYLLPAALWALLLPPDALRRSAALVAGLTAATTLLVLLLLPGALLVHRTRILRVRSVQALVVGLGFQAVVLLFGGSAPGGPVRQPGVPPHLADMVMTYVSGARSQYVQLAWVALAACGLVVALALWRTAPLRPHVVAAVLSGALVLVAPTLVSGQLASRYVASASMIAFAGVAIGIAASRWTYPLVAVMALLAAATFPADPIKFAGPSWTAETAAWHVKCQAGARAAPIPVSPPGWGEALVACSRG